MSGVRSDCKFCSSFQADNLSSIFVPFYHHFTNSLCSHLLCCTCKFCSSVQADVLPSIFLRFHFHLHSTITCVSHTLAFIQILWSFYPHLHQPTPCNLQVTSIFTSHISSSVFQYSHSPHPHFHSILYLSYLHPQHSNFNPFSPPFTNFPQSHPSPVLPTSKLCNPSHNHYIIHQHTLLKSYQLIYY